MRIRPGDPDEMHIGDPDKSVVEWIRSAAIPLATVEPRQGYKDLEAFRAVIDDARIVSLGEATHGTREFRKFDRRLLEFCVTELGFTMLGIEAPFPESLAVNAYVLDGVGNAADALVGTRYWIWDNEELLDTIEWMRWWNASNVRKVKFYGFVTDYPAAAARWLIGYLARVAPDLAAECKAELAPVTSDFTAQLFKQLAEARRDAVFACIARVRAAFEQQRPEWIAATSARDWHLGRLHARVLDQATRFQTDRGYTSHDRIMAENVCALLEAEGPDAKAVLWSHNAHASRVTYDDGKSMGGYLEEMVGRAQRVIGTAFDRGAFQARTYPTGEFADHSVSAAAPGSFDAVLAQAGLPLFALDLANAPRDGPVAAWLASEMQMRSIGGIWGFPEGNKLGVAYTVPIKPRERFDAVMFVAETSATRGNQPLALAPNSAALPAPTNLALSGDGVPTGWQTGVHRSSAHTIAVSQECSPRGGRTVCVSRQAPWGWGWGDGRMTQRISAQAFRGKRLRFSAAVRTTATEAGAGALLYVRFLPKPNSEAELFQPSLATVPSSVAPMQSPQWATIAVEADVPEAAEEFVIGLVITGNGVAWFGDLELSTIMRSGEGIFG
jgi:erythromycin esterase